MKGNLVYTYKSLKIEDDASGLKTIYGLKGKDIISEIIPDAVEFINRECRRGAFLKDLNGVDFFVRPNESVLDLVEKWKYENFRVSGLEF